MKIHIHKKSLIIYLVALVGSIVFASFYGGPVSYAWLYAMLLLIPVSILYIILNYHFFSIYQEIEIHKISKGEDYKYRVFIDNSGVLPIHDMTLGLFKDRCKLYEIEDGQKISLGTKEKLELFSGINCIYAGAYDIGIETISFTDPFHVYTVTLKVPYSFRAIVSPRITDMADKVLDLENLINNTGLRSATMLEDIPSGNIRSYQPGDSMSSINWKVSARLSELVVKLPDPMEKRTVSIFMKAANIPEREQDTEFLKKRDKFLEFAVSAAWHFGKQKVPVKIIYPAGKVQESIVDSYESFMEFFNRVSDGIFYSTDADVEDIGQRFKDIRGSEHGTDTWIVIREDYEKQEDFCTICG